MEILLLSQTFSNNDQHFSLQSSIMFYSHCNGNIHKELFSKVGQVGFEGKVLFGIMIKKGINIVMV